jgi:hypothetical protein
MPDNVTKSNLPSPNSSMEVSNSLEVDLNPRGASFNSPKLSTMPLAVLLPSSSGSIAELSQYSEQLKTNLSEILSDSGRFDADEDGEKRKKRAAEESMLNQVLQWLSLV